MKIRVFKTIVLKLSKPLSCYAEADISAKIIHNLCSNDVMIQ